MDYATLKDPTDWLSNHSRACENLDVLPLRTYFTTRFYGEKDWKDNEQQKFSVTMRTASMPKKRITSRMKQISQNGYVRWTIKPTSLDTAQLL